jgi:excisionase family DNA binding protein
MDKMLNVGEVAAWLQVHPSSIYRMLKRHEIPAFRIGSDWRFASSEIENWFKGLSSVSGGVNGGRRGRKRSPLVVV